MKKWYLSKTIWVNVLAFIAAAGASLQGDFAATYPAMVPLFTTLMAGINLALRFVTDKAIE